jgi:hypothetical protein
MNAYKKYHSNALFHDTFDAYFRKIVFWLMDQPTPLTFPSLSDSGFLRISSPITAAGPPGILTLFRYFRLGCVTFSQNGCQGVF